MQVPFHLQLIPFVSVQDSNRNEYKFHVVHAKLAKSAPAKHSLTLKPKYPVFAGDIRL